MKVGDLVSLKMRKTQPAQVPRIGIVINRWRNHKDVLHGIDVLWGDGAVTTLRPDLFEVISEGG